ncbi:DUF4974 domain-containing protein [Chitinophaga pendula]|uniref:FecR family protein n=1 Tax=Chitinophaga TaxID=79328 RepID=UPI000BAE81E6|nr:MULTISPECIES: FecR domain-containing protein [Chitinophaga]ASZ14235.1 hypothetical protein CK934_26440 [Chitinophaga sp. MD30]UCJ08122.1 DUF4974 domain-containing protein [Chitinophaga pendula]
MKETERIYILMARKISGVATEQEERELNAILAERPELQYSFHMITELEDMRAIEGFTEEEEEKLQAKGLEQLNERIALLPEQESVSPYIISGRRTIWKRLAPIAAVVLLLAGIYPVMRYATKESQRMNEVVTTTGSRTSVILPDGTMVMLNACSKLEYDIHDFMKGNREVTLQGEGYFDVKTDAGHPFIIKAGQVDVRVLGTVFNLKAYPEDGITETTLISGKVEVALLGGEEKKVVLAPQQKLSVKHEPAAATTPAAIAYNVTSVKGATTADSVTREVAWMTNKLAFENMSFAQLARELERWYNVKIKFRNDRYKEERLSGAFKEQPVADVLAALQLTSSFRYSIDSSQHIIDIW